jgi:hypothetical protein
MQGLHGQLRCAFDRYCRNVLISACAQDRQHIVAIIFGAAAMLSHALRR